MCSRDYMGAGLGSCQNESFRQVESQMPSHTPFQISDPMLALLAPVVCRTHRVGEFESLQTLQLVFPQAKCLQFMISHGLLGRLRFMWT